MTDVTLTIGEDSFTVEFQANDRVTGSPLDLTLFNDIRLFIKSTDFVTSFIPGGTTLGQIGAPENGLLSWEVLSTQIPSPAGQYYGQIVFTQTGGEIRKSLQFDITVKRKLD